MLETNEWNEMKMNMRLKLIASIADIGLYTTLHYLEMLVFCK